MGSIARLPECLVVDNSSYNLFNMVRQNTTDFFKSQVPFAKNQQEWEQNFESYATFVTGPGLNAFTDALGWTFTTILETKAFKNIYAKYKAGYLTVGDSIREIWNNLPIPTGYTIKTDNPSEIEAYTNPGSKVVYHPINCRMFIKDSFSDAEIKQAFNSPEGFSRFMEDQTSKMFTRYEQVEFLLTRYTMCRAALDNWDTNTIKINKELGHKKENLQFILTEMQTVSDNLIKTDVVYTPLHNETHTAKEDQLFWLTPKAKNRIGVYTLAEAFNLKFDEFDAASDTFFVEWTPYEVEQLNHIGAELVANGNMPNFKPFTADELAKLNTIVGCIVDKDFFKIYDVDLHVETRRNQERLYTNWWLHFARIFSYSPLVNMVIFTAKPEINDVEVEAMDPDETIFGYNVNDLQSDIIVTDTSISGNLTYQTEGSLVDTWGAGNFIALKFDNLDPTATSVKVGLSPSMSSGLVELDEDKNGAFKVTNTDQKFVVVTKTATGTKVQTYDLTGLSLATS